MERRANVWRLLERISFFFFFFVIYSILVQGTLPKENTFGILKRGESKRILHIASIVRIFFTFVITLDQFV